MLESVQGTHGPMRLHMERSTVAAIQRPGGLASSNIAFDALTARDELVDFDDYLGGTILVVLFLPLIGQSTSHRYAAGAARFSHGDGGEARHVREERRGESVQCKKLKCSTPMLQFSTRLRRLRRLRHRSFRPGLRLRRGIPRPSRHSRPWPRRGPPGACTRPWRRRTGHRGNR